MMWIGVAFMFLGGMLGVALTITTRRYLAQRCVARRRTPQGRLVPAPVQLAEYLQSQGVGTVPGWFRVLRTAGLLCYVVGIAWIAVAFLMRSR